MTINQRIAFFLGVATPLAPLWIAMTAVGALVGSAIPPEYALDFALPITFLAMIGPMLRTLAHVVAALTSMGVGLASFLGLIGDRAMPPLVLRLLRYTPVAVLPAMVAPLVVWPDATGGVPDPVRIVAALVALGVGIWRKDPLPAIGAGAIALYFGLWLTGRF